MDGKVGINAGTKNHKAKNNEPWSQGVAVFVVCKGRICCDDGNFWIVPSLEFML